MKRIVLLFLLSIGSIRATIIEHLSNPDVCFEIILNEIAKIAAPSDSPFDGNCYTLSDDEFFNLRSMLVELALCVDDNKITEVVAILNKLHHAVMVEFPVHYIEGYNKLHVKNQRRIQCVVVIFCFALWKVLRDSLYLRNWKQQWINLDFFSDFINKKFIGCIFKECKNVRDDYTKIVGRIKFLCSSALNVTLSGDLGNESELEELCKAGLDDADIVAEYLLNRIIKFSSTDNDLIVDDILSVIIANFIVACSGSSSHEQKKFLLIELYGNFIYMVANNEAYNELQETSKKNAKNSALIFGGSLAIMIELLYNCAEQNSLPSFEIFKKVFSLLFKKSEYLRSRIIRLLKRVFELLVTYTNSEFYLEIYDNYEDYIKKLNMKALNYWPKEFRPHIKLGEGLISVVLTPIEFSLVTQKDRFDLVNAVLNV